MVRHGVLPGQREERALSSRDFYAELPLLNDLRAIGDARNFKPLPADWHVVLCDVRDSTGAVQAGRYKNVNTVGAAVITAVLNAARGIDIPFIFEGDGSTLCVPPELLEDARAALLQTQALARRSFGLELRIATLPVAQVVAAGHAICVARFRVSENYAQAGFIGGGIAYAERFMKDPATAAQCAVSPGIVAPRGSYEGLECRWHDIPSPRGETLSLMVRALAPDRERVYRELLVRLREIYGSDEDSHPVHPPNLRLALSSRQLGNEAGVRAADSGAFGRWLYLMKARFWSLVGAIFMALGVRTQRTDWGGYKTTLVRNADVRKFNDGYRQVLAGTAAQRAALGAWLEERFARGELVYGLHVADRALMTCLVFDYAGRHLHFIDGADGGYFLAARELKRRASLARQR